MSRPRDLSSHRQDNDFEQAAYQRFARAGAGPRVQRARDRLKEIADELKELGSP
ncbi:MAG TPA: hypothetical protein VF469_20995 [Kofleriaceae bacterium]